MAEDTAAYTLKPGPKAELDGLRAAREEFGPIPPRPGTPPVRVGSARAPPHLPLTCSPCDAAEMKVTREEMKNARLPLECAQIPLMRTTHASPHARTPPPAAPCARRAVPCRAVRPSAPSGQGGRQPAPFARRRRVPRPACHRRGSADPPPTSAHLASHAPLGPYGVCRGTHTWLPLRIAHVHAHVHLHVHVPNRLLASHRL